MDERRDALLLVDLQIAFFENPGLADERAAVVSAANALADAARAHDVPIFLITTEHSRDRSTWTLNMLDDDQGFLFHGDDSTAVVEDLVTEGMTRVEKTRDSAWFGTDLSLRLRNLCVGRIVLAGVSTHGCIAQTTRDAYAHNVRTTLVTDAIADERRDYHETMIAQLAEDRQADLRTVAQVRREWAQGR
jgi:nicotinamidase-related amidase